jgi:glycosyltransferase involved in cell wall biosynthesis
VTARIVFVTTGDQRRLTGGNLYNRRVLQSLCEASPHADDPVDQLVVPGGDQARAARDEEGFGLGDWLRAEIVSYHPALLVVDSIALASVARVVPWLRNVHRIKIVALMHMLPSALAEVELNDPERGRPSTRDKTLGVLRALEHDFLRAADCIVAVSPPLRDTLIAAGALADRVEVVLPGWDAHASAHLSLDDRVGPANPVRFLCVANWSPAKGIHRVVRAMASLRAIGVGAELDLVGDEGVSAYAGDVRAWIERYDLTGHVHRHGSVAPDVVASFYHAADVFVLPSRSEGFGTVFAEAMSYGLPIVAEAVSPLFWLVGAERGILVSPGDECALAEAMRALAVDPDRRREVGRRGRVFARRLPTWSETGTRFAEIVRAVLMGGDVSEL